MAKSSFTVHPSYACLVEPPAHFGLSSSGGWHFEVYFNLTDRMWYNQ
ncbi:hypothetical protein KJK41_01970 [Bacillus haikouensis]|nr:hypothetical protein KJK41_01970 [Bacillus haikouensis]